MNLMRILATIPGVIGMIFGRLAYSRLQLRYNEDGRFLDVVEGVVYDREAIVAYGVLAGVFLFLAIGMIWRSKRVLSEP